MSYSQTCEKDNHFDEQTFLGEHVFFVERWGSDMSLKWDLVEFGVIWEEEEEEEKEVVMSKLKRGHDKLFQGFALHLFLRLWY